ncbi:glycosyltransferase family 9 protein [Rodentibacter caecimuris]|uniref:ADP-heptose--LPS heptosyltransferase I n=1 Tax=Rodentibacter caecimuris TaxID=1796644 RepID=A0ABX3L216_9PAST|nr:ADP-heptose--LPS heptosyltransferase I [Rodentibacter heylii]
MPLFEQAPKSICILRLSAVGDVCNTLAAVQQIRDFWQTTEIVWIIGKTEMQLVAGIEGITFVPYDKKSGWVGIFSLWRQLKDRRFDVLLNMQTAFRASILSLGIRATYKVGFGKQRSREMQSLFVNRRIEDPDNPHVLDGFMAFAKYLGIPIVAPYWRLPISEEDYSVANQFLDSNRKNLIIAPCSSKPEKDWLIERYAKIANIAYQHHFNVIFCGAPTPREVETTQKITALCDFSPINAVGKTTLKQLAALIGQADLVIAPDSGPAHIATMQNTPIIGLYAYHNPLRTGPYNNLTNVVSVYEENVQKEQGKPSSQLPWVTKLKGKNLMAQIQVDVVVDQMKKFINLK